MIRCLLVTSAIAAAGASEVRRADLGLWLESLPTSSDYTLDGSGGSRSGNDTLDSNAGLRVGARFTRSAPGRSIAPQIGLDVVVEQADYAGALQLQTYGLAPAAGVAWAPGDNWLVSSELFGLFGMTSGTGSDQQAVEAFDVSGRTIGYGLRLDGYYRLSRNWLAGAVLSWRSTTADLSGTPVDLTWTTSGIGVGLGMLWRMDVRPAGLE